MAGSIGQATYEPIAEADFTFRPLSPCDFPVMFRWRINPAVAQRWDPAPDTIDELEPEFGPMIDGAEPVNGVIVEHAGTPIAFIQWYRLHDHPDYSGINLAPAGAAGIDLFIGEDDYRYHGYGAPMLRAFLRVVLFAQPDITACAIDPLVENTSAISAYRRTGFREAGIRYNAYEHGDSLIMLIDRADLIGSREAQAAAEAADADQDQKG
jgi:aminoglycoside 6'-N-acetyltransferase